MNNTDNCNAFFPQFSFFRKPVYNQQPYKHITAIEIHKVVSGNYYKNATLQLRTILDKKAANKFKCTEFDFACFSGTFKIKNEKGLIEHSGLICLDFDNLPEKEKLREKILADPFLTTVLLFTSPTGTGLKWIVKINLNQGTHIENFQAIENYIFQNYHVEIDSGSDVARPCFLPYDPDCYINYSTELKDFDIKQWLPLKSTIAPKPQLTPKPQQTSKPKKQKTFFDVLQEIEKNQIDIAPQHDQWMKLGFIIAENFGERGREYFKRLSRFYNGRITKTPDQQYNDCLKGKKPGAVRMNTFFQYAKEAGIEI